MLSEPMGCDDVGTLLAASADDASLLSVPAAAHVASCLRCQAEQAQYRRILRTMKTMKTLRDDTVTARPELLGDVLDLVRPPAEVIKFRRPADDRRRAAIGGIAAAATGAAAGAIVLASRIAGGRRLAS